MWSDRFCHGPYHVLSCVLVVQRVHLTIFNGVVLVVLKKAFWSVLILLA